MIIIQFEGGGGHGGWAELKQAIPPETLLGRRESSTLSLLPPLLSATVTASPQRDLREFDFIGLQGCALGCTKISKSCQTALFTWYILYLCMKSKDATTTKIVHAFPWVLGNHIKKWLPFCNQWMGNQIWNQVTDSIARIVPLVIFR